MAHIIKIGNSQGVRIPKPLVEQANLEGKELKLQLVSEDLLISPEKVARAGWKEAIEKSVTTQGSEALDSDWLQAPLVSDADLEC